MGSFPQLYRRFIHDALAIADHKDNNKSTFIDRIETMNDSGKPSHQLEREATKPFHSVTFLDSMMLLPLCTTKTTTNQHLTILFYRSY